MQYFVKDGGLVSKIKVTSLRKLLMVGSKWDTSLDKKPWVSVYETSPCGQYITAIDYYNPDLPRTVASKVYRFNDVTKIHVSDFHKIFEPTSMYNQWREGIEEANRIRQLVIDLEEAAIEHGKRLATVANGFIASPEPWLRDSGSQVKDAKWTLYKELGV